MTMIKCDECGKDISDKAPACIGCGAPVAVAHQPVQPISTSTSVFTSIGDLNGDGKVDFEDLKIAGARAKDICTATANGALKIGQEALHSDMAKDAAAGAVVGAAIAIPIPLIGPAFGAAVGGGIGVLKNLTKK